MTAKEKAQDIVDKVHFEISWLLADGYNSKEVFEAAKRGALIVLKETVWGYIDQQPKEIQLYWEEVKQEIERL